MARPSWKEFIRETPEWSNGHFNAAAPVGSAMRRLGDDALSRRNADLIAELWRGDGSHASFAGFPILGRRPGCQDDRGSGAISGRFVQIRKQGVAVSQGELDEQVLGVAAPIRDARGSVVVAVSIAALASRVPRGRLKSVEVAVKSGAATISEQLAVVDI